ncbi:helix-turn-helix domain-containing protein [Thermoplasmatales archaeon AK]|nr:helix-turn-helix domain-containing protein [Thermoplasmatales archaeon AK]
MKSLNCLNNPEATIADLLSCLYDLNVEELRIFQMCMKLGRFNLDEIAEMAAKDRTTIHRILQKLVSAGLVTKEFGSIPRGGRISVFGAMPLSVIKMQIRDRMRNLEENVSRILESL